METLTSFAIILIFVMIGVTLFSKNKKKEPDESARHEFAKKMLRGETTPEEIAFKEGYELEQVKKWKDEYTQLAVKYALEADKHNARLTLMEDDIKWFKEACRKHIGDDWEKKTGFAERDITKFGDKK